MSNQMIPDQPDAAEARSTDPGRFQQRHDAEPVLEQQRQPRRLRARPARCCSSGSRWCCGCSPAPTRSRPRCRPRRRSTGQLTFTTLLNVLLFVVWLAWLFFVVCVVVEVLAARRGGLAQPVPLGGPLQKLARALVGALLLAEVISGPAASALAAPVEHIGCARSRRRRPPDSRPSDDVREAQQQVERRAAHEITAQEHLVGHKVYTVAAPKDGYHDNLWDIAERHLGDGRRYQEIYELNKGLLQLDGRRLELARLIQPGWNLVMPDDAVGVQRMSAAAAGGDARRQPRSSSEPDAPGASHGQRAGRGAGDARRAARHRPAGGDRPGGAGLRAAPPDRCRVGRRGRRGRAARRGDAVAGRVPRPRAA